MNCNVCEKPSVGVASSRLGPISLAFCAECLQNGAEPEILMWYLRDGVAGGDVSNLAPVDFS